MLFFIDRFSLIKYFPHTRYMRWLLIIGITQKNDVELSVLSKGGIDMKAIFLFGIMLLFISMLCAEVLFFDDFQRPNGAVGNGWTNVGPSSSSIENGVMKLISDNNKGIKREFEPITSGIYYVQFDWKLASNDWLANAFPNDFPAHLLWDYNGDIYRDADSNMSAPILLANVPLNTWTTVRWKINNATNRYSLWIDGNLVADNILGNTVNSFFRFTFRSTAGSSTTQYVDNFLVFNEVAPPIPQNFAATSSVNAISLAWDAVPNPMLVTYKIYRSTITDPTTQIAEVGPNVTTFVDELSRADANTDYYYRIRASVEGIDGAYSIPIGPVHLNPQISVTPQNITFNVGYGYSDSTSVTIANSGSYPLIWSIEPQNPPLPHIQLSASNGIVQSGQQQEITLNVNTLSLQTGTNEDVLILSSNDPQYGSIQIMITTNVLAPQPTLNPSLLEFKIGLANQTQDLGVSLTNNGQGLLNYSLSGTDELGDVTQLHPIAGFTPIGLFNGHRYYQSNNTMYWQTARNLCAQNGGYLVSITTAQENEFIRQHMTAPRTWIGLTDEVIEGQWRWTSGEPYSYSNWNPGEPNNSGNEDYVEMYKSGSYPGRWNDLPNSNNLVAILEFDYLLPKSIITFSTSSGILAPGSSDQALLSVSASHLTDGIYETSIQLDAQGVSEPHFFPVAINVDFTPPLAVSGLQVLSAHTNADQIGISWLANDPSDQVASYRIFRKGRDEATWRMLNTVPHTQLSYTDSQFTGLDSTYVWYKIAAIDWVGNIGAESEPLMAALERFPAPANLSLELINGNRDAHLSWNPVTQTIAGTPATPSCYLVYTSNKATPTSDFVFHSITTTNEFTHPYVYFFVPENRVFYIVTAYGGTLGRLQDLVASKDSWTRAELERELTASESSDKRIQR